MFAPNADVETETESLDKQSQCMSCQRPTDRSGLVNVCDAFRETSLSSCKRGDGEGGFVLWLALGFLDERCHC